MNLTTLARVKTLADIATAITEFDDQLTQLITEWSAAAEQYMNRKAETVQRTQQFDLDPGQQRVSLEAYGDAAVLDEVKNSSDRDFAGASAEDLNDFFLDPKNGLLALDIILTSGPGVLQVKWTGGMGATDVLFAAAFPDIAHAVDIQVVQIYQRHGELGVQGVSFAGQSFSASGDGARWLSAATAILDTHRRFSNG